jgi:hypothetical protein
MEVVRMIDKQQLIFYKDRVERNLLLSLDSAANKGNLVKALRQVDLALSFLRSFKHDLVRELTEQLDKVSAEKA